MKVVFLFFCCVSFTFLTFATEHLELDEGKTKDPFLFLVNVDNNFDLNSIKFTNSPIAMIPYIRDVCNKKNFQFCPPRLNCHYFVIHQTLRLVEPLKSKEWLAKQIERYEKLKNSADDFLSSHSSLFFNKLDSFARSFLAELFPIELGDSQEKPGDLVLFFHRDRLCHSGLFFPRKKLETEDEDDSEDVLNCFGSDSRIIASFRSVVATCQNDLHKLSYLFYPAKKAV